MSRPAWFARPVVAAVICCCSVASACSKGARLTSLPRVDRPEAGRIVPDWYVNPPADDKSIVASGSAVSVDMQLALTKAQTVARAALAEEMQVTLRVLSRQFAEEVGRDSTGRFLDQFTRTVEGVVSATLVNTAMRRQHLQQEPSGYRAFVLMAVSRDDIAARLLRELKANEELLTRLRSTQAFKDLEASTSRPGAP